MRSVQIALLIAMGMIGASCWRLSSPDFTRPPRSCGGRCRAHELCCDGQCILPSVRGSCNGLPCGKSYCSGEEQCCNGACVSLNTNDNCGSCSNSCGACEICIEGTCETKVCAAACQYCNLATGQCDYCRECCNNRCTDFESDNANCGRCGHVCPFDASCQSSLCMCNNPALVACGASCCDGNCCGGACCGASPCNPSGVGCGVPCSTGEIVCGTKCIFANTPADCGSCGRACSAGEICLDPPGEQPDCAKPIGAPCVSGAECGSAKIRTCRASIGKCDACSNITEPCTPGYPTGCCASDPPMLCLKTGGQYLCFSDPTPPPPPPH
jgi:hypothetical protein